MTDITGYSAFAMLVAIGLTWRTTKAFYLKEDCLTWFAFLTTMVSGLALTVLTLMTFVPPGSIESGIDMRIANFATACLFITWAVIAATVSYVLSRKAKVILA